MCLPQPCQVPREWKRTASSVKTADPSADAPNNYGSLDMPHHHCQALTSMPVNLSMTNSVTTELYSCEHGGVGKSAVSAPLALVKTESQTSAPVSCSSGSCQEEPRVQSRMVHEQGCYDLSLSSFPKDKQSSTLGCTYEDSVEEKVRRCCYVLLCNFSSHSMSYFHATQMSSFTDVPEKQFLRSCTPLELTSVS